MQYFLMFIFLKLRLSITFKHKKTDSFHYRFFFAEKEGFEPPDLLQSIVFKTTAIDHSAISPVGFYLLECECKYNRCFVILQIKKHLFILLFFNSFGMNRLVTYVIHDF